MSNTVFAKKVFKCKPSNKHTIQIVIINQLIILQELNTTKINQAAMNVFNQRKITCDRLSSKNWGIHMRPASFFVLTWREKDLPQVSWLLIEILDSSRWREAGKREEGFSTQPNYILPLYANTLKSLRGTFKWLWISLNLILMPTWSYLHQRCLCPVETLQNTLRHTGREVLLFMSMIDLVFSFLPFMVESWRTFFFRWFQYFVFMAKEGIVQINAVFLSLSSRTNACARQDLYDSPRTSLQSKQNNISSEGLKSLEWSCYSLYKWFISLISFI